MTAKPHGSATGAPRRAEAVSAPDGAIQGKSVVRKSP